MTMDNIREIPGYYYDTEKKKYFKIQASGQAPPSSAYSSKDVKRRKIKDERSAALARETARQQGRIRRSRVLEAPLLGRFLDRERGYGDLSMAEIYARGLCNQGRLDTLPSLPSHGSIFTITPRGDLGQGLVDLRIALEDKLFTIRLNTDKYNRNGDHGSFELCCTSNVAIEDSHWSLERFGHPGMTTSLSINEHSRRIAMTWLSGTAHSGIAVLPMTGTSFDEELNPGAASNFDGIVLLGPGHWPGPEVDVLSSTAGPPQSNLLFAFGTSNGIITMEKEGFTPSYIGRPDVLQESFPRDVFALEFLSDNHNVLLSGGRSGILNLTDLRIPRFWPDPDIITHPSSITHIRQLDTHRIIVAGLNSHLCQYDLRFRRLDRSSPAPPNRRNRRAIDNPAPTRSIVQYPDYHNSALIHLGFDVDMGTGVVAACQERAMDPHLESVRLFSLHGGHKLESPILRKSTLGDYDEMIEPSTVRCVRFAKECDSKMKSLYAMNRDFQRYAWVPEADADPES